MNRRIFLDCGGHDGSSVRKFRRTRDPEAAYEIVTFEPNPRYALSYRNFEKHHLIAAAVWIEDGTKSFYLDPDDGDGSSLFRNKQSGALDRDHPIQATTVDLSAWIRRTLSERDEVILKLDVEGAEYEVLDKMLLDGTARYVGELLIEWHWSKVGVPATVHRELLDRWKVTGIPTSAWDALGW